MILIKRVVGFKLSFLYSVTPSVDGEVIRITQCDSIRLYLLGNNFPFFWSYLKYFMKCIFFCYSAFKQQRVLHVSINCKFDK